MTGQVNASWCLDSCLKIRKPPEEGLCLSSGGFRIFSATPAFWIRGVNAEKRVLISIKNICPLPFVNDFVVYLSQERRKTKGKCERKIVKLSFSVNICQRMGRDAFRVLHLIPGFLPEGKMQPAGLPWRCFRLSTSISRAETPKPEHNTNNQILIPTL